MFLFIVCEEREATLVPVGWTAENEVYKKKKWGLKSHGWLLEPTTTFSLVRKSQCTLHLHFLSILDMGVKMCSSLQTGKRQHFWVSLATTY